MTTEPTCAIWYWRRGAMEVRLFANETEAAEKAGDLHYNAEGGVEGIQFADGRLLPFDEWDMPDPLTPQSVGGGRFVSDPFGNGAKTYVEGDVPSWLGKQ